MNVEIDGVGRIYSWDWAVREVSAKFDSGDSICILGANGSGKSTLLNLISGLIRPTSGHVRIDGRKSRLGAIASRKRMMLVHPDQPLIGNTILNHIGAALSLYGCTEVGIEDKVAHWLDEFGLSEKKVTLNDQLSRGEKAKLWLTNMFTVRPDLWLLDEPHQCGLDAHGIEVVENQIEQHCRRGGIVIFTSQWPPHARRLANRIVLLDRGQMAYEGSIDLLHESYNSQDNATRAILRLLESESGVVG